MKPALSLVFFTVLSGAGFGVAVMLALFAAPLSERYVTLTALLSVLLVAGGLGASVGHLANPKNAWRAVMRARTSWLSREAVLAAAFFPLALVIILSGGTFPAVSALVGVIALATIYCTAMIYQSLRTIPEWHHPLTAFNYLMLGIMSGGVLFNLLAAADSTPPAAALLLTAAATAAAAAGKYRHYRRIGASRDISVGRATGFSRAKARLLDAGHTGPTFLTREFVYHCPAELLQKRRGLIFILAFPAALLALLILKLNIAPWLAVLPLLAMFGGILLERWLFFAEAHHSVRAYHGVD